MTDTGDDPLRDDITRVLQRVEAGEKEVSEDLLPLVYGELRRLATELVAKERPGQSLQATALVHEAYLRLLGPEGADAQRWDHRGHFFIAAAESMRRILIDRARARGAIKRGGNARRIHLDPEALALDEVPAEVLDLDEALNKLALEDPVKANVVKLRFFGGLTMKQVAAALDISPATADRHWSYARAWLYHEITHSE